MVPTTYLTRYTPAAYFKKELMRRQGGDTKQFPKPMIKDMQNKILGENGYPTKDNYCQEITEDFRLRNFHLNTDDLPRLNSLVTGIPLIQLTSQQESLMMDYYEKFMNIYTLRYPSLITFPLGVGFLVDEIAKFLGIQISPGNARNLNNLLPESDEIMEELYNILIQIKYENSIQSVIILQSFWRMIIAQREKERMKIKNELEFIPGIGIQYFQIFSHWNEILHSQH